jgi:hypothetical protein
VRYAGSRGKKKRTSKERNKKPTMPPMAMTSIMSHRKKKEIKKRRDPHIEPKKAALDYIGTESC